MCTFGISNAVLLFVVDFLKLLQTLFCGSGERECFWLWNYMRPSFVCNWISKNSQQTKGLGFWKSKMCRFLEKAYSIKSVLRYSNNHFSLTSFSFFVKTVAYVWPTMDWSRELVHFNGFWQCFDLFAYNAYTTYWLNFHWRLEWDNSKASNTTKHYPKKDTNVWFQCIYALF